jgi:hypothetical protein
VDEQAETLQVEDEAQIEQPEQAEARFTQRELVRASLLRCPPPEDPAESPRP